MAHRIARLLVLVGLAALLGGCADQPLGPDEEGASLSAQGSLTAPSNLRTTVASPSQVDLAWRDNSSSENSFEVHRSTAGPGGAFALLTRTGANVSRYSNSGLSSPKQYCYKVRAVGGTSKSPKYSAFSTSGCATTSVPPDAPAVPTGTTATSTNSSTVAVTWTDNSANETGFQLERASNLSGPWEAAGATSTDVSALTDGGRASDKQVCYRVAAFNANRRSTWSEAACATPPAGPTNLRTGGDQTAVGLTWSDNSTVEDGYEVQRATTERGPYSVIANLAANATTYRDEGLASDQLYWYRLRATRAGGFSDLAGPAAGVAAGTPPTAPTWVSASPFNGWSTYLVWKINSTNAAGFRLERSDGGAAWITIMTFGPAATEGAVQVWDDTHYPQELEICYRVVAFNGLGESSATGCTALPALPLNLTAKVVDGAVELSWTDVSRFEDGFYIVRADGNSMGFYYVYDAVGPNATTYRDVNPDPEWSSYYLRAIKGPEGYSCCSNAVDVNMPPAPEP
jgi:hypothetical protein